MSSQSGDLWNYLQQMHRQWGSWLQSASGTQTEASRPDGGFPFASFGAVDRFPQEWSRFLPGVFGGGGAESGPIPMDLYETDRDVVVVLELPGLRSAADASLNLTRSELYVRATIPRLDTGSGRMHVTERKAGAVERTISLPVAVRTTGTRARYAAGLLEVRMQKEQRDPTAHRAEVPIQFGRL
ncbi:MAG: Hsp20/alpha crystallin family protein [Alicyclobacillus sp.]|nr:Hsp20/alpha crystallin family protein [Alicyclobacillus sp.]